MRTTLHDVFGTWFQYARLMRINLRRSLHGVVGPGISAESYAYTTAQKIVLPGCPNLFQVSGSLYRGGQPTARGLRELEKIGVRTVVSLRSLHGDHTKLAGTSLNYCRIKMRMWDPQMDQVQLFVAIAACPINRPLFVHCLHGSDRTGLMIAAYRVVIEGWTKQQALEEMIFGPFGYQNVWKNLPHFLYELNLIRPGIPREQLPGV